ncbi:MAG: putative serine protease HtrA [Chroococcopsis gigantea SAG 12.99]|jgi:serine protease Do|nr:putative serine protease HtrA [Chroococcopsis gigantea SAG 12.99]
MTQNTFSQDSINRSSSGSPLKKLLAYSSLIVVGAGIGIGGTYAQSQKVASVAQNAPVNEVVDRSAVAAAPMMTPTNFVAQVVQEVGPAVVRINASHTVNGNGNNELSNDPFFRRFFGDQMPEGGGERQVQRGTGSGFIISEDGKILTNAHVVEGAEKVTVTLKDGRTLNGKVLGSDSLTDVAVIKIEGENLPTVALGNSDSLQVGEWAIAIGNPLGLDNTVTTGIISAKDRSSSQIGANDKRVGFLQTDAAINPGNSGGPLLNAKGEVIGMNTAIIQNAQGLGFAIPINKAQKIAQQIIDNGQAQHPYLGVQMLQLNPDVKDKLQQSPAAQNWNITQDSGVLIVKVMPDSPASRAGVKAGDVITNVQGKDVTDPGAVQELVENSQIGSSLPIEVSRGGDKVSLNVEVGQLSRQASR